jgi:hypothetical protein
VADDDEDLRHGWAPLEETMAGLRETRLADGRAGGMTWVKGGGVVSTGLVSVHTEPCDIASKRHPKAGFEAVATNMPRRSKCRRSAASSG